MTSGNSYKKKVIVKKPELNLARIRRIATPVLFSFQLYLNNQSKFTEAYKY